MSSNAEQPVKLVINNLERLSRGSGLRWELRSSSDGEIKVKIYTCENGFVLEVRQSKGPGGWITTVTHILYDNNAKRIADCYQVYDYVETLDAGGNFELWNLASAVCGTHLFPD